MIIEAIFNALFTVVTAIIDFLPTIPGGNITDSVSQAFDLIFSNLDFFTIFIRPETIQLIIPLFIAVSEFDTIYNMIMWVAKKIPMLGIE